MKRIFCFLLCCVMLGIMLGCNQQEDEVHNGNAFYYPLAQLSYDTNSSAITAEYRSVEGSNSWTDILNVYFSGPQSEKHTNPFPAGLQVKKADMEGSTLHVTLSKEMAQLTGLELMMACSCLSLTSMALSGAENIVIRAEDSLLDGQKSITLNKDTLLLIDKAEGE